MINRKLVLSVRPEGQPGLPRRGYLGALGMTTGLTTYAGLNNVGEVKEGGPAKLLVAA